MDPRAAKYRAELEAIRANADPVAFAICQRWHEKFAVPGHGATSFVRGQLSAAEVAVAVVMERLGAEGADVARLTAERDRYREALERVNTDHHICEACKDRMANIINADRKDKGES